MKPDNSKLPKNICRQCSLCVGACPTFSVYREEPLSAKGRVVLRTMGVSADKMSDLLWECRTCGMCQSICPPQIPHMQDVLALREKLTNENKVSEDVRILKGRLIKSGNPFGKEAVKLKKRDGKVLLWTGCVARFEAPEIIDSSLNFLAKVGINAALLEQEDCCGAVDYFLGDEKTARERLKKLLPIFAEFDEVISLCSSCWVCFNELIPKLLGKRDKRNNSFPKISHLLDAVYANTEILKPNTSSFFQFPCRMANWSGRELSASVDSMIRKIGFENNNIDSIGQVVCCGGSSYEGVLIDLSQWRIPQILQGVELDEVVTVCPGCYVNLKKNSGRNVKFLTSLC